MRIAKQNCRKGTSLMEVLIAMMVLAIGMMGILALFPIGAAQFAQAIKDERTAQLADICDGHFRLLWRSAWLDSNGDLNATPTEPAYANFSNGTITSTTSTPSVPLYMDPIGIRAGAPNSILPSVLPQATFTQISNLQGALRLCSLMDDISFNSNGLTTTTVQRAGRYNAAYLLQRPNNIIPQEVSLKVVVYQNRSPDSYAPPVNLGTALVSNGQDYVSPSGTSIPSLRKGSWLLLAGAAVTNPSGQFTSEAFADFYRVVGSTQIGAAWTFSVSPPIRNHSNTSGGYNATVMFLDNVVEVFDRGTITPFAGPSR